MIFCAGAFRIHHKSIHWLLSRTLSRFRPNLQRCIRWYRRISNVDVRTNFFLTLLLLHLGGQVVFRNLTITFFRLVILFGVMINLWISLFNFHPLSFIGCLRLFPIFLVNLNWSSADTSCSFLQIVLISQVLHLSPWVVCINVFGDLWVALIHNIVDIMERSFLLLYKWRWNPWSLH